MEWSVSDLTMLKELAARGYTGSQIGRKLGRSRSAILGKIHRDKIPFARSRGPTGARPRRSELPRRSPVRIVANPAKLIPPSDRPLVAFADLLPHHCRWPFGDPQLAHIVGFGFCGAERFSGSSYCRDHFALSCGVGTASERRAAWLAMEAA